MMLQASAVPQPASAQSESVDFVEKRRAYRQRVLKGGTIINGSRNSEMPCTLCDQHAFGAQLKIAAETMIPSEFVLYVPIDGVAYRGVLRWRRENRAGIEFLGVEEKPRHHYG